MAFLGHLGPLWPLQPRVWGTLRPLLAAIRWGQGGPSTSPQGQVGPHEPIFAPKNGQKDCRTRIGQEAHSGHLQPRASGNHQRPPAQAEQYFPSVQKQNLP
ncbi:hypothetical protein O181_017385 [Austropuccinia psidii MF-1]|uniref:Uncharacterized protein n=1 Tax=Austropuccinia psidii MF-1 TaxID=1389203 RepID=A0A9Q3GSZ0_9BASI|nr:hypothetical protein [Austropuccinia psidii MF-1]